MKMLIQIMLKIIKVFVIVSLSMLLLSTISNAVLTYFEKNSNPPLGKMVKVNGGQMHVYIKGNGPKTIVLMSGFGTSSPVLDFMPLVKALEKDYTVCVVECFGYGWSSKTDEPRTNEKIIEEIRLALKKTDIHPPYILVPHSISGIYALHYANKYPKEIESVVNLDTSFPKQVTFFKEDMSFSSIKAYGIARILGILRFVIGTNPSVLQYDSKEYTESDQKKIGMITCWNLANDTMMNEESAIVANCNKMINIKFPESIPVRMILSKESVMRQQNGNTKMDWLHEHEKLIEGNLNGKIEIFEGRHYIHYGNAQKILETINEINEISK